MNPEALSDEVSLQRDKFSNGIFLSILIPVYNEKYLVKSSLLRILQLKSPLIKKMEVIIVDDGSTDGTREILRGLASQDSRIKLFTHDKNQGKGAAIRTALYHASGDISMIHDADMEYHPEDIPLLLKPFIEEGADAVFGSRYLSSQYRRVLMFRHSLKNKAITTLVNLFTDLDLSDVETCYKAIKTDLFKTIPIRSKDFRFEVEIAMKLAKRRARIFEVPIRYLPRSYEEGKKIKFRDGILALWAICRFQLLEDIFHREHYGLKILMDLNNARQFNKWMADTIRPFLGQRILEIGAGIATLSSQFIPREHYVASDIDPQSLHYLKSYSLGKPYLKVARVNAENEDDFLRLKGDGIDTVVMINVLEHVSNEAKTLNNIHRILGPGGKAVILVPQFQWLYGSFDRVLKHRERYTKEKLKTSLQRAGFDVQVITDFNRFAVPAWFVNSKIFRKKRFTLVQLKLLEIIMPLIRRIDKFIPWGGLSLIAVASKK